MYVVYPGSVNYTFLYQRPQQLMRCFGWLGYEGIYINGPAILEGSTNFKESTRVSEGLTVVPSNHRLDPYSKGNSLFYCTYPPYMHVAGIINPKLTIFDSIDEPVGVFKHWNIDNIHDNSIKSADVVLASASKLYQHALELNDNTIHVPNGCDFAHFKNPQPEPEPLKSIPKPRITFTGAIASWLDKELILKIANEFPDASIVLVGPFYDVEIKDIPPNIHILGHQPYETMPGYLHNSDVLIIPFDVENPVIEATNPIKLWEYLATGKPIVTTNIKEVTMSCVWKGKDHEDFLRGIERFLTKGQTKQNKTKSIRMARQNSWMERARRVKIKVDELL